MHLTEEHLIHKATINRHKGRNCVEIYRNIIIIWDFNTPLTSMDRSSRQKMNKETEALNDTLDQMNLTYIWNIPSKNSGIHTVFKCTKNILQNRSHIRPQNKSQ